MFHPRLSPAFWSTTPASNRHTQLGRLVCCHYINGADARILMPPPGWAGRRVAGYKLVRSRPAYPAPLLQGGTNDALSFTRTASPAHIRQIVNFRALLYIIISLSNMTFYDILDFPQGFRMQTPDNVLPTVIQCNSDFFPRAIIYVILG